MELIQVKDKKFRKMISSAEIDEAVTRVAQQINQDYQNETPIILVTLNGAIIFASDLLKQLNIECVVTCVKVASYRGTQCTDNLQEVIGLTENIEGKRVLIIEDIVDTGNTYIHLAALLKEKKAKDVRIATMTFKPDTYDRSLPVHYIGINIPSLFVVGRGLDYDGLGRNLVDIYQLHE